MLERGRIVERGTHAAADGGGRALRAGRGGAVAGGRAAAGAASGATTVSEPQQRPLSLAIIRRLLGYTRPYARLRNTAGPAGRGALDPAAAGGLGDGAGDQRPDRAPRRHRDGPGRRGVPGAGRTDGALLRLPRRGWRCASARRSSTTCATRSTPTCCACRSRTSRGRRWGGSSAGSRRTSTSSGSASRTSRSCRRCRPGQAAVSAALMIYYDWRLFLVVMVLVPGIWLLVRHVRGKLSQAYRDQQESFSRVTASLAESVTGIREIQGFAREQVSDRAFAAMVNRHAGVNMVAPPQRRHRSAAAGVERPALPVDRAGRRRLPGAGRGRVAGGADPVPVPVERRSSRRSPTSATSTTRR